jgi:hypothetical protein
MCHTNIYKLNSSYNICLQLSCYQEEKLGNLVRQGTFYHRSTFVYERTQQHLQVNKMYTNVAANALHYFEGITESGNTKGSNDV